MKHGLIDLMAEDQRAHGFHRRHVDQIGKHKRSDHESVQVFEFLQIVQLVEANVLQPHHTVQVKKLQVDQMTTDEGEQTAFDGFSLESFQLGQLFQGHHRVRFRLQLTQVQVSQVVKAVFVNPTQTVVVVRSLDLEGTQAGRKLCRVDVEIGRKMQKLEFSELPHNVGQSGAGVVVGEKFD